MHLGRRYRCPLMVACIYNLVSSWGLNTDSCFYGMNVIGIRGLWSERDHFYAVDGTVAFVDRSCRVKILKECKLRSFAMNSLSNACPSDVQLLVVIWRLADGYAWANCARSNCKKRVLNLCFFTSFRDAWQTSWVRVTDLCAFVWCSEACF